MKKLCALTLAVMMLLSVSCAAVADAEGTVPEVLASLLNGKKVTLTLQAENIEVEDDLIPAFGGVVCEAFQNGDKILVTVTSGNEEMSVNAVLTAQGIRIESSLLSAPIDCSWETLMPSASVTTDANGNRVLSIRMTGPDRELINMTVKVKGTELANYQVSVQAGFITGPGAVHGMWDFLNCKDGSATRDFSFTYDENDLTLEGCGEETAEVGEDGSITVNRVDEYTVYMDEEEMGSFHLTACLSIQ